MRLDRLRKLPYYAHSVVTLAAALRPESWLRMLLWHGQGTITFRNGLRFEVPELLDLLVLKETLFDDVYRLGRLSDGPGLIVDVGAGIGDFTVLAASRLPRARVVACEPNPQTFAALERNVRRNRLSNVDMRCVAVGTQSTYALGRGRWSAKTSTFQTGGPAFEAPAVSLDELIGRRDVELLKIDCEGAELDVLESLDHSVDQVRRIAVEYHDHLVEAAGARVEQLLSAQRFVVVREPDRYDGRIGYVHATASRDPGDPQDVERHPH
jgi:FkbM family methyltransferase